MNFNSPYVLIHQAGKTHFASGEVTRHMLLAEVPRGGALPVISMVPYAQLRERGFAVHDGGEPVLSLKAATWQPIELDDVLDNQGEEAIEILGKPTYSMSDEEFTRAVAAIIEHEIRNGEGANFLMSRKCRVQIQNFSSRTANTIFRRLAQNEFGAYMTFCFFDGERYFIGSSPERHVTIQAGTVRMNPICGTLPKRALSSRADLIEFLSDPKEINELFQVVDEELKMMSRLCHDGGDIYGPFLKEMSSLIHTEYQLEGHTDMDNVDAFRESMFAATMIGSPLENAARIIHKYENESRRYYSSALMIEGRDEQGQNFFDSAITIRTMEVDAKGEATIQSGASIVRDSVPEKECSEIKAKAEGVLRAITSGERSQRILATYHDAKLQTLFESRNKHLSRFWLEKQVQNYVEPDFQGKSLLIIDNEDEFTFMLKHLLDHLGLVSKVVSYDDPALDLSSADFVLVGPGPGDPTNFEHDKMRLVHGYVQRLLDTKAKFLAVCLGHQILCHRLGMPIVKLDPPLQGVQKTIELFERSEPVGFYNTFFAMKPESVPEGISVASERTGHVNALRSRHFVSFQFHVESVLTTNGLAILRDAVRWLLRD